MKKALLTALTFIVVGFMLVNGTLADDFSKAVTEVFEYVKELGAELGLPKLDTTGQIDVALVSGDPQQLYPGGQASHATAVRNDGTGDVYFRLCIAFQYDTESWDKLQFSFSAEGYQQSGWLPITISDTPYRMMVFTYPAALASGVTSPQVSMTIAMDDSITTEQLNRYHSDFLQIQVLAIDAAAFVVDGTQLSATDALDRALPLGTLNPF